MPSASSMATSLPRAARVPVLRLAPEPPFSGRRMTRTPCSAARRAVWSVDASSTTRISHRPGHSRSASRTSWMTGTIASCSL